MQLRVRHPLGGDEVRLLEQPDVVRHSGKGDAEALGEIADRGAGAQDVRAGCDESDRRGPQMVGRPVEC